MKRVPVLVLLVFAGLLFCAPKQAQAAVATIELQAENDAVRVGEEFEVTLWINVQPAEGESAQAAVIGDFEAYLIYNADVIEFVTAPSCFTGGAGMLKIADMGASPSVGSRKYVMRFRALSRGVCDLSLDSRPIVYTYGIDGAMSVSSNVLTLAVEAAQDASDNANLSALKVSPGKISPAFATTVREYEVTVPYESERIVVSALTEDENAVVGVNGSTGLKVGRNTVVVTVTAENGTEKHYYLYVTRQEETPEPTKAPAVPAIDGYEPGLHATDEDGRVVISFAGEYKVSEEPGAYVAPTGYEETVLYVDGVRIKAYVKRDKPDSEFYVLVLEDEFGISGYYRYDRRQQTLQRYDEERIEIRQVVEEDNHALYEMLDQYKGQQVFLIFMLAMFLGLSVLLLLVVVKLYRQGQSGDSDLDDSI
ncbi:MAG: cadherin-like beta sandwich domain-containing protein [Lachnospiraceae bacterium]|nr:cadherin-like beta sandwich domain-containing protein [Lachnospiraceae bacterium]